MPAGPNRFPVCVHCRSTKSFGEDRWAVHSYAPVEGHELVTRRDLFPAEPDHPRAGQWYYKLQLGPLEHKLPPIVAHCWRRVTFIVTSGDRFMQAVEINDLFEQRARPAVCTSNCAGGASPWSANGWSARRSSAQDCN